MSDDDEVDWLAAQFAPTEQVPQQPAAAPSVPVPPAATAPAATPPTDPNPPSPAPASAVRALPPTPSFVPASAPVAPADLRSPSLAPPVVPPALVPPAQSAPVVLPPQETPTEAHTPPSADEPTQPLTWDEFTAAQLPPAAAIPAPVWPSQPTADAPDQPTEAYTVQPWAPAAPAAQAAPVLPPNDVPADGVVAPTSAIDALFNDQQFQAYEEVGVLAAAQGSTPLDPNSEAAERPPRAPLSRPQKILMAVAGGLILVLILIGMFFLGQHIGVANASLPSAAKTTGSTTVPKPAGTGGPAANGVQLWSALQGGECIDPFTSAWATTFTVVSCTADHDAQMVFKGTLPDAAGTAYPSTSSFQTEITPLCSASTAINYAAAGSVTDLQVSFSYPASASKWIAGDRTYYCFVDRQSGGNLTGDLAVAKSTN